MKLKTFFILFKELSIKRITQMFLKGESPTLMQSMSDSEEILKERKVEKWRQ